MDVKMRPSYRVYTNYRRKSFSGKYEFLASYTQDLLVYCEGMIRAVHDELLQYRHCWLIDHALSTGHLFSADWAAIHSLCSAQNSDGRISADVRLTPPDRLYDIDITPEMEEMMLSLYHQPSPAANNTVRPAMTVLTAEAEALNSQLTQARQDQAILEERNRQLRIEAGHLQQQVAEARQDQVMLEEQNRQLRIEAGHLQQQVAEAQRSLQAQRAGVQTEADRILQEANEQASRIRAEMIHDLAADMTQPAAPGQPEETLRSAVSNETQRLEATIRTSFDAYRDEIHRMLYEFRTGLFRADYSALCFAYQKLYLFATDLIGRRFDTLISELADSESAARVQSSLRNIQGLLIKRIASLEDSLKQLGLTVYRPAAGEEYNAVFHAAENAEDDGYLETTVQLCVCPGIRTSEQVLCRAAVIVDTDTLA